MKNYKKYILLVILVITASVLGIYAFTFAKYVSNSIWDYYLKSKGFYFSSDYLDSTTFKNVNNQWDGGSIHFSIRNNLNESVVTNHDIAYNVTCTVEGDASLYSECHMNGTGANTLDGVLTSSQICTNTTGDGVDVSLFNKTDCELGGYSWVSQIVTKDLYFDVVLTDTNYELSDVVVNVIATSTSPYRKTISGEFKLHKSNLEENNITIDYKNYSNYDRLIVSNSYSVDKCVRITWDSSKLIIDAAGSEFSSYGTDVNGYINEIIFNIGAKKSLSYIFYKKNFDMIYDVNEFIVEETSGCL